ncbi:unnamed protein product [Diamesa serratosioi]
MSIFSESKTLNSSILKSTPSNDRIKENQSRVRFKLNDTTAKIKDVFNEVELNPKNYQNLIYKLAQIELKDDELERILLESIECVPLINKDFILFVDTILSINWMKRNNVIIKAYHCFIINLLTARSDFLVLVLSKIVNLFTPEDDECELWKGGRPTNELSARINEVHKLLKNLLDVIPMIPVLLRKQLQVKFPYHKKPSYKIVGYIHNLLLILDYFPNFTNDIMELIFENLLNIDVNVSRSDIELAEEEAEHEFDLNAAVMETNEKRLENIDEMKQPIAETLDICMEMMCDYFHQKFSDQSVLSKNSQNVLFATIIRLFDVHILPTHNVQSVQYIIFYICSFNHQFLHDFLTYLWEKCVDRNSASIVRQTAIGYLSSFLARAKFLPVSILKSYLKQLCHWAHNYLKACDYIINRNPKAHAVFYATCQAIFYIIAFRSQDLTSDINLRFLQSLELSAIVKSTLNPLNVCLPAIATIFDSVTHKYQIVYCHTILVKNASRKLTTVFSNDHSRPEECLESVFPFDPYLLKKSGKRIKPIYVEYRPCEEESRESSPQHQTRGHKRIRHESTSMEEFEDFIMRESKMQKVY